MSIVKSVTGIDPQFMDFFQPAFFSRFLRFFASLLHYFGCNQTNISEFPFYCRFAYHKYTENLFDCTSSASLLCKRSDMCNPALGTGEIHMTKDLTQGNVTRVLLSFSIPLLLSTTLQQFYNIADSMIVGQ